MRPRRLPACRNRSRHCRSNSPQSNAMSRRRRWRGARRSDFAASTLPWARARPWCTRNGSTLARWLRGWRRCPTMPTREISMRWPRDLFVSCVLLLIAGSASAQKAAVPVEAVNASTRTACAEKDNVYVKLQSKQVRDFRIEATHPAYLNSLTADNALSDFTACGAPRDPVYRFTPREVVLHDAGNWTLRGFTYPVFWRPNQVPVRIGERVETGLHLLQLWTHGRARDEEVLVLYPADGYW